MSSKFVPTLSIGDWISDNSFKENLEDTTSFLSRLIQKDFSVSLSTTLSISFSSFASYWHFLICDSNDAIGQFIYSAKDAKVTTLDKLLVSIFGKMLEKIGNT